MAHVERPADHPGTQPVVLVRFQQGGPELLQPHAQPMPDRELGLWHQLRLRQQHLQLEQLCQSPEQYVRHFRNILYNWGVPNTAINNYLSWNSVVNEINANRPFVIRYGWTNGGGHIMVGRGYETYNGTNYIYIMNPWPGEGQTYRTFASAVSAYDHNWTHTQRMNVSP
jgi:hypothetical protein